MLHMGNLDQVFQGFHSLPLPYNNANGFKIKMWNLNGTITTPRFGKDYVEEYYNEDKEFLMVLELPDDIKVLVGSGSLLIDLDVDIREEEGWTEEVSTFTYHTTEKIQSEAESDCRKEGGNLASVTSEEENLMVAKVADYNGIWLGGRRELGEWTWSDNSTWGYTKSRYGISRGGDCLYYSNEAEWSPAECDWIYPFICQRRIKGEKKMSLTYTKDELNQMKKFVVWYKYEAAKQQLLGGSLVVVPNTNQVQPVLGICQIHFFLSFYSSLTNELEDCCTVI